MDFWQFHTKPTIKNVLEIIGRHALPERLPSRASFGREKGDQAEHEELVEELHAHRECDVGRDRVELVHAPLRLGARREHPPQDDVGRAHPVIEKQIRLPS